MAAFSAYFFVLHFFSPKGKIIMKCETPKTWKANLFKYFYTKRLLAGFKYYIYRFLFINHPLDKMYHIRPVIIMYTFLQPD